MNSRLKFVCALAVLFFAIDVRAQDDTTSFPYQAFVLSDNATVHSGPASVHYTTDKLPTDTIVEVYRHDPGGWCAIKPPAGAFSLIPEKAIERIDDKIGRVTEDGTKAWVGTRTGTVEKPLWQIKLRNEEQVAILGEVSWPNPEGHSTIWYQIAPPAGEFRWIRISDLKLPRQVNDLPDLPADLPAVVANTDSTQSTIQPVQQIRTAVGASELTGPTASQASAVQEFESEFDAEFEETPEPPSENNLAVNHGWRRASGPVRIADRRADSSSSKSFTTPAIEAASKVDSFSSNGSVEPSVPSLASSAASANSVPAADSNTAISSIGPINGPVSERVRRLESSLTAEMLKSPETWNLEPILQRATSIATTSNLQREQEHANRLIQKIRNCTSIQSRFQSAYIGSRNSNGQAGLRILGRSAQGSGSRSAAPTAGQNSPVQLGTTFDAHGWLNQLVRGRGSMQPTYVLENDQGQITHHISPTPGLNLSRYLKSKVGVVGRRGFDNSLQLDHVAADRVVVIDQIRR